MMLSDVHDMYLNVYIYIVQLYYCIGTRFCSASDVLPLGSPASRRVVQRCLLGAIGTAPSPSSGGSPNVGFSALGEGQ